MEGSTSGNLSEMSKENLKTIREDGSIDYAALKIKLKLMRDSMTPLHLAVIKNDKNKVKQLIQGGADLNATNYHGDTPLHCAQSADIVDMFLPDETKITATNNKGYTFLDMVLLRENFSLLKYIVKNKLVPIKEVAKSCNLDEKASYIDVINFIEYRKLKKHLFKLRNSDCL